MVDFRPDFPRRLGFRIDPVEILEYQEQWLNLALAKQQTFIASRVRWRAGRIESLPLLVVHRNISRATKAGSAVSRVLSSVSSLPVTFSRISR